MTREFDSLIYIDDPHILVVHQLLELKPNVKLAVPTQFEFESRNGKQCILTLNLSRHKSELRNNIQVRAVIENRPLNTRPTE